MIRLFLKITDEFLYTSIENAFRDTENAFRRNHRSFDIVKELKNFENQPIGCMLGTNSKFEIKLKLYIKLVIGFYFVFIPFFAFAIVFYFLNINILFSVFTTLLVSILASRRTEQLAKRYVEYRFTQFT